MITIFHIVCSVILFFVINVIGNFAPTNLRYFQISGFLETDEAPAFNYSFRVLTPVVFIILLSALLYALNLNYLVINIYMVAIYYVGFRAIFNIFIGRFLLVNWKKQLLYGISIISLSYFIYIKIIITKANLLPDFANLSNELWIIIIIFLYNLVNNIQVPNKGIQHRKLNYITIMFNRIKTKYHDIIIRYSDNNRFHQIAYAIILHENFNRPKLFRWIEYIKSFFSKEGTYGIMQVKSEERLNDKESVERGVAMLHNQFLKLQEEFKDKLQTSSGDGYYNSIDYFEDEFQSALIRGFNHCDDYKYEIMELVTYLNEKFYGNKEENNMLFSIPSL